MDGFFNSWPLVVTLAVSGFLACLGFLAACITVASQYDTPDEPEWLNEVRQ